MCTGIGCIISAFYILYNIIWMEPSNFVVTNNDQSIKQLTSSCQKAVII